MFRFFLIIFVTVVFSPLVARAYFDSDLKLGDTNIDVYVLQKILNTQTDTKLAVSGPGSPQNETNFFGAVTFSAVVKFQEKYSSEILAPYNLSTGTGYVGAKTREKLKQIFGSVSSVQLPSPSQDKKESKVLSEEPVLNKKIDLSVFSQNGVNREIIDYFENKVTSNSEEYDKYYADFDQNDIKKPVISSINPKSVMWKIASTSVSIKGQNFSENMAYVISDLGAILAENVSNDEIKIYIDSFPSWQHIRKVFPLTNQVIINIKVASGGGISDSYPLTIDIP